MERDGEPVSPPTASFGPAGESLAQREGEGWVRERHVVPAESPALIQREGPNRRTARAEQRG